MKTSHNVPYGLHDECLLDTYLPDENIRAIFLYFHGGGLEGGDKSWDKAFIPDFIQNGYAVISANYRTYPKCSYPDFLYDGAQAVKWVKENFPTLPLFVGGSSAGGYISQMLCFDQKYLKWAGLEGDVVTGFVHDAGQPTAHFNVLSQKGIDSRRVIVDETAPLYHVGTRDKYVPMLIIASDNDMQNRLEQTHLLISTLKHFGHEDDIHFTLSHGNHCDYVGKVENGKSVFAQMILPFFDKYC
ncbi:MAG: alpha/beta hydrolase [Clostridia bacterium]|nr:alpha/beta hydrolase [Clostridia bacterium]